MLEALITSKTRLKLLIKFFVSSTNTGYLRGIAEEFNESTNSIRKELNQLSDAGYLVKSQHNNKILYKANETHPLFKSLQKLIHSYLGIDQIIENVLDRAGDVSSVALIGDYAKGLDSGEIEVLILGNDLNTIYLLNLADKTAQLLRKKINLYFEEPVDIVHRIVLYDV
ncbi:ArsR family transcriptional regulator [Sphingobacterium hungaricum]|uniref:Transcriptional regulator n=1 Tax=Sphingobacterium hungaricum TaxID=2082723 RepID=A0A928YRG4_9SPHI|nr:ArsR family transcriptional regulator [Sphingobacterium hungaricum]MBE8714135.1 transcriptional regulator [Sphingobacterium hungaricum]